MGNERQLLTTGLILAVVGVVVLGADRITASADSTNFYGQSMTVFTVIGLVILLVAAIIFFKVKPR